MEPPKLDLTVVLSGRNDNWMGTFDTVTPYVCARNCELIERYTPNFEIVFVEWAPLEDRPPLSHRLAESDPRIRCLIVPKAIHDGFHPNLPFLQYHARNVGIRRAQGRIVLATNGDILLSPAVVLSLLALDKNTMLRVPRCDVSKQVLQCRNIDEIIAFSEDPANQVAIHAIHRPLYGGVENPYLTNAAGDFIGMSRNDWFHSRGFHQRTDASMGVDAEMIHQAEALRIDVRAIDSPIYHVDHEDNQQGRMHFPPYSRSGFANPPDWGLGDISFIEERDRVFRCSASHAGTFGSALQCPTFAIGEGVDLDLTDARALDHKILIACGLGADESRFLLRRTQRRRRRIFVWDGIERASGLNSEFATEDRWKTSPRPIDGALFLVSPDSPALAILEKAGAEEGRHFVVCEKESTTLSFLRLFLRRRCPDLRELILLGFGHNGRHIADRLRHRPLAGGVAVRASDDSADACEFAARCGLLVLRFDEVTKENGGRLILVTPSVAKIQRALVGKLTKSGLTEGKDFLVDFRETISDRKWRRPPVDHWKNVSMPDGRSLRVAPELATLQAAGEFDLDTIREGSEIAGIAFSCESTSTWNQYRFPRIDSWQRPRTRLPVSEVYWLGIESPAELAARQMLAVSRKLFPLGGQRLKDGPHAQEFKRALRRQIWKNPPGSDGQRIADAVAAAHAAAETADGTMVHLGLPRENITRWLMLGGIAGGYGKTIYSVSLGNHGWDESDRPVRGYSRSRVRHPHKAPFRVARLYEHPATVAVMLRHHLVRLLVLTDFEDNRWIDDGFYSLSPLLADGGLLVLIGSDSQDGAYLRFMDRRLRLDRRFEPLLWQGGMLILRRVPLTAVAANR